MALLSYKQLAKIDKNKYSVHRDANWTYSVFRDNCGKKYFQIDTYGSEDRKMPNKISQSLQFDEETALYLINVIKNEFNL